MISFADNQSSECPENGEDVASILGRMLGRVNIPGNRLEIDGIEAAHDRRHRTSKLGIVDHKELALPGVEFHSFEKGKRSDTFTFKIELSFDYAIQLARIAARLWPLCGVVEDHIKREQERLTREEKNRQRRALQRVVSRLGYLRTRHVKCNDECHRIFNEIAIAHEICIEAVELWVKHYKRNHEKRLRSRRNVWIKRRWRQGYSIEKIATSYRLSSFTVVRIVNQ